MDGTTLSHMGTRRRATPVDKEQVKALLDKELVKAWRKTCADNAVSQNEAIERIFRWYVAQDRTLQQFVLGTIPPEMRPAVGNFIIRSILDWAITSSDQPGARYNTADSERLREVAGLYHVTLPPTRNPDGSIEQVTRSFGRPNDQPPGAPPASGGTHGIQSTARSTRSSPHGAQGAA